MSEDNAIKKVTVKTLQSRKKKGVPITVLTAYDYASAKSADGAGIDVILVGDSLGQVVLGMEDTVSVTMDEMLIFCRAVARAAQSAWKVGDLPFMSYHESIEQAIRNAGRMLKEGRMDAVKLEGGVAMAETVRAITRVGIPVVGHIGFTPQSVSQLGGYRIQGKSADSAYQLVQDALALTEAGCVAIVLEMIPAPVAKIITEKIDIPTIGIGAGEACDGQVLVYHDLLGLIDGRHPSFIKEYATLHPIISAAIQSYIQEVKSRAFPSAQQQYGMTAEEYEKFIGRISA